MKARLRSNRHVVYGCTYHVVWCPKYRRPVLVGDIRTRLLQILHEVVRERSAELVELDVKPDHVHLLLGIDPQYGIHRLVKGLKGRSSRVLRDEFPTLRSRLPTLWTHSYFVATVGGAPRASITQYIEQHRHV